MTRQFGEVDRKAATPVGMLIDGTWDIGLYCHADKVFELDGEQAARRAGKISMNGDSEPVVFRCDLGR